MNKDIQTDNSKTLENALKRIEELERVKNELAAEVGLLKIMLRREKDGKGLTRTRSTRDCRR